MPQIKCPECGMDIPYLATSCPNCAAPVAQTEAGQLFGQPAVTAERTNKKIKKHALIAGLMVIVGSIITAIGTPHRGAAGHGNTLRLVGEWIFFVGAVWYIVTRVRGWWHRV